MSSALRASPCARTMIDYELNLSSDTQASMGRNRYTPASPESPDQRGRRRGAQFVVRPGTDVMRIGPARLEGETGLRTCFASTAWVNSGEKATCVIETSSSTILKRSARRVKFSRTNLDTCVSPWRARLGPRGAGNAQRVAYLFTLSDDLTRVELCDDALEYLVDDGRQDAFIIISAQLSVDGGQCRNVGTREDTTRNVDHLQVWRKWEARMSCERSA